MVKNSLLLIGALALVLGTGVLFGAATPAESPEKPADKEQPAAGEEKKSSKSAEAKPDKEEKADKAEKPPEPRDKEVRIETQHLVTINGTVLEYTATAGKIVLRDNDEKPTAGIFYIAYTKRNPGDLAKRPITFSFNGGPGSSAVWMNLGLLGPRRVLLKEDGSAGPPPYKLVDNDYSLLDETDLVFIDPVSTGFSRAVKNEDAGRFHGLQGDLRSVGEFIRIYTTRNLRWDSPKFVIGESYGTTRAAGLTGELRDRQRMNVNGVMLVSTVLNFATLGFERGHDLPYALYLPTYAATAWYHKKLPADLQQLPLAEVVSQAAAFAAGDYNRALFEGSSQDPAKHAEVVRALARFTGLPEQFVQRADLRVSLDRFAAELLRDQDRVIGRFDSRYTGYVRDRLARGMEYDPSFEAVAGAFGATFNNYVRAELEYKSDLPYELLAHVGWDWGEQNSFVNVAETLADSMTRNPFLKVHVSSGYYDLATPWMAARYTLDHLQIDPALARNITLDTYTAGHMMYLNLPDLKKQKADLARFIRSGSGGN